MKQMTNNKKTTKAMTMRMTIELADNGIILRNPDCEDEVTLAIEKGDRTDDYHHEDKYRAIGQKIYDWLMYFIEGQNPNEFITTGFQLKIEAKCEGRERQ